MLAWGATPEMVTGSVTNPEGVGTLMPVSTLPPEVEAVWEP